MGVVAASAERASERACVLCGRCSDPGRREGAQGVQLQAAPCPCRHAHVRLVLLLSPCVLWGNGGAAIPLDGPSHPPLGCCLVSPAMHGPSPGASGRAGQKPQVSSIRLPAARRALALSRWPTTTAWTTRAACRRRWRCWACWASRMQASQLGGSHALCQCLCAASFVCVCHSTSAALPQHQQLCSGPPLASSHPRDSSQSTPSGPAAGAGLAAEAEQPAVVSCNGLTLAFFSYADHPEQWAATPQVRCNTLGAALGFGVGWGGGKPCTLQRACSALLRHCARCHMLLFP